MIILAFQYIHVYKDRRQFGIPVHTCLNSIVRDISSGWSLQMKSFLKWPCFPYRSQLNQSVPYHSWYSISHGYQYCLYCCCLPPSRGPLATPMKITTCIKSSVSVHVLVQSVYKMSTYKLLPHKSLARLLI